MKSAELQAIVDAFTRYVDERRTPFERECERIGVIPVGPVNKKAIERVFGDALSHAPRVPDKG